MKRFLVIGNPIDHSLSPKLHNYWIKKNNIDAIYEKQKLEESDLENLISQVREKKICGILNETTLKGNKIENIVIGFGLNVNQETFENLPNASSLKLINKLIMIWTV